MTKPTLLARTYYRRHLPHFHPPNGTFFVTFRLKGTLPRFVAEDLGKSRAERRKQQTYRRLPNGTSHAKEWNSLQLFEKFDSMLDLYSEGPLWLKEPEVARLVADAIHFRDGLRYDLVAYCIMPDHVHLVFSLEGRPESSTYGVARILENLKWYTALKCNQVLGRRGAFWQDESYDRVIRDGKALEYVLRYVLNNPVKAGLVQSWTDWHWSYCKHELDETPTLR
jgi:REP element-mobilizing transposase RayT